MSSPSVLLALLAVALTSATADATRPRDRDTVFNDAQRGRIMPLPQIEQRARDHPAMKGAKYLGPEFDDATATYRLKFMRGGRVVSIDIDARNGRVLRTSGD